MSDEQHEPDEHESDDDPYGIGTPVDEDYIDVEKRRANVRVEHTPASNGKNDSSDGDELRRDRKAAHHAGDALDTSFRLDAADGSGSASKLDERIDDEAVIEHDGRAETRTFFYPEQASASSQEQFRRLIRWQEGEGSPQRDVRNRAADRRRYVDTFCGRLDMTEYQRERVKRVVDGINMSHMAHYNSQKVILAIISLVADEDASRHGTPMRDRDTFQTLVDEVNSSAMEVRKIRLLVRDKSDVL